MIYLILVSFLFGLTCKLADLYDEHGVPEPFRGARMVMGVLWGAFCVAIMALSPTAGLMHVALLIYWVQRQKLDFANHAIGAVVAFVGAFAVLGGYLASHWVALASIVLGYYLIGVARDYTRDGGVWIRRLWRTRFTVYLVPAIYGWCVGDFAPLVSVIAGMVPTEILTLMSRSLSQGRR